MERPQHRDRITPPSTPISARSQPLPPPHPARHIRPLLILGGAWLSVLVVALVAVNGLLNPNLSKQSQTSSAAIASRRIETVQVGKQQTSIPLWLFGAIALSCTVGCGLISRQANRPARPRQSSKPQRLRPDPVLESDFGPAASPPTPLAPSALPLNTSPNSQRHSKPGIKQPPTRPLQPQRSSLPPVIKRVPAVPVTVVPDEESHPLDWGEASLADTFDLRKQRSMSSWL